MLLSAGSGALMLALVKVMPFDKLANSETPISDALTWIPALGSTAGIFVAITAMIVILGSLSSCVMYQPRLEYAMAKDNLFFKCFGHVHPKIQSRMSPSSVPALTSLLGCSRGCVSKNPSPSAVS